MHSSQELAVRRLVVVLLAIAAVVSIISIIRWLQVAQFSRELEGKEAALRSECFKRSDQRLVEEASTFAVGDVAIWLAIRLGQQTAKPCIEYVNMMLADPAHMESTRWDIDMVRQESIDGELSDIEGDLSGIETNVSGIESDLNK
jgi:hypothetical protein